jgi:CRISPR-associated protein Csb2
MPRLVIEASPLIDRWSVSSATRRDRAQWPPSPDTLFSALIAAAASRGNACHPALRWLETLGNPAIEANFNPPRVEAIETFCPVADRTEWDKGARQARIHNSVGNAGAVKWSWHVATTEHLAELQRIAREVTYIGSSRGPVIATVSITEAPLSIDAWVPDDHGMERIRGLYAGRLDELEAAYQRGERPRPTQTVRYARVAELRLLSPWGQLIPLRRTKGQPLHVADSVPVAEAVRRAIMRYLPDAAPCALTGHGSDGASLRDHHLAVVPLPRIDDQYADGELLGVGLLLPRELSGTDYEALIGALGSWLASGGHIDLGSIRWTLEIAHDDHRASLRDTRYSGTAATWASVTPIVFDRHPRRTFQIEDAVGVMCRDVGLPVPRRVDVAPTGWLTGAASSREHGLGRRDYLARNYIAHLRVEWSRKVPGPIVLGRGRYFGLGVMLPLREAA